MEKKMRNILIALIIGFQVFPITVYGKGKDAFLAYQEAMQKTVVSGNWKEELDMDADMTIIQGKAKTKTKVTLDAVTEVSGYDENDSSAVQMTGSASMAVLGQKYIWNMTYRDGTAHYEYKEPVSKTVDVEMNPNYFQFSSLTQNMMKKSKISGNEITFTIPAEKANEHGQAFGFCENDIVLEHRVDVGSNILTGSPTGRTILHAVTVLLGVFTFEVHRQTQASTAAQPHQQIQRVQAGPEALQRPRQDSKQRKEFL